MAAYCRLYPDMGIIWRGDNGRWHFETLCGHREGSSYARKYGAEVGLEQRWALHLKERAGISMNASTTSYQNIRKKREAKNNKTRRLQRHWLAQKWEVK